MARNLRPPKDGSHDRDRIKPLIGFLGFGTLVAFIVGLAHSISTGFAGFWGRFPFWVICLFVLALTGYDYWDECLRKRR